MPFGNMDLIGTLYFATVPDCVAPNAIKKVIFHDPATVIYWSDGTRTVVKVHNEPFDKEKGFCMAIMKKALGDRYHKFFKEYCHGDTD